MSLWTIIPCTNCVLKFYITRFCCVYTYSCRILFSILRPVQVYVFTYSRESMCGGDPEELQAKPTMRNSTSTSLSLADFCYRVIVFPVNHKAWGPGSDPLYFTFTRLPRRLTVLSGLSATTPSSTLTHQELDYVMTCIHFGCMHV